MQTFCTRAAATVVAQNCILRGVQKSGRAIPFDRLAECNSAIQQIANLRYENT
jgi:hypothetical protein